MLVDGVEIGQIKNDETEEYSVEPGTHTIQCKVNWMSSEVTSFTFKEGAKTFLKVRSGLRFIGPLYVLMLIGVLFPFYFHITKSPMPAYIESLKPTLIFPAIIYYILYVTFLRKHYLVIEKDASTPFS